MQGDGPDHYCGVVMRARDTYLPHATTAGRDRLLVRFLFLRQETATYD
jgi:hypothetical protein